MNLMSIKSHCFCLHNSFLKKLTLQYYSVVVLAVPPEEIGRGSFASVFPFYFTRVIFIRKGKLRCLTIVVSSEETNLIGCISDIV